MPMPDLSPEDYESYIRKNQTWNFWVNVLDLTFYHLATSFVYGATVLSLYARYLTPSATLIGVIPAIQSVGYFLPQLLAARQTERLVRKKPLVQKISVMERLPYLFVAASIFLWPEAPTWFAFGLLAISLALATGSGGLAGPAWQAMLAKVIPARRRGLLFGLARAMGALLGMGGAMVSRQVLATYQYPTSFGISFGLCFLFQIPSWICLSLNREPPKRPEKGAIGARDYMKRLPNIISNNPNFGRYLVGRALVIMGAMGTAFYVIYARDTFLIDDAFAANLTMASLIGQAASLPLLGWLADRRGHKWLAELGTLIGITGVLLILVAPNELWLYAVYMLMSVSTAGVAVAGSSIILEFCPSDDVPTFSALSSTLLAIPILVAPVFGGWLVDAFGYRPLFVTALGFALLGLAVLRWAVREPRHEHRTDLAEAIS